MEKNGCYKVLHFIRKSTQLTAYASASTCLGTGKSVGVLYKIAQKMGEKMSLQ